MKKVLATFAALALTAALAQPVQIGILSPLTGGAAGTGQAQLAGFQLALEEINAAGGVLGSDLELVIEDTQANVAVGLAAFEKLMTDDGVEIIAGGYSSGVTLGLVESFRTFQPLVTWIGGASSGSGLDDFDGIEELLGEEPWFFHIHPWDYQNTEASTGFIASTGASAVAVLHEDSAFGGPGGAAAQQLVIDAGMTSPLRESFTSTLFGGTGDFRAAINRAKSSGADMLYWIGYDGDVIPMASQIRELDYRPNYIFGAPPGWPAEFAQTPEAECVTGLIGYLPNLPNPEAIQFRDAYFAMHNSEP